MIWNKTVHFTFMTSQMEETAFFSLSQMRKFAVPWVLHSPTSLGIHV